eukprot:3077883-Pleurochrysis_carterae.AAC.1
MRSVRLSLYCQSDRSMVIDDSLTISYHSSDRSTIELSLGYHPDLKLLADRMNKVSLSSRR